MSALAAPNQTQAARAAFLSALAAPGQGRTAILSALAAPADCNCEGAAKARGRPQNAPLHENLLYRYSKFAQGLVAVMPHSGALHIDHVGPKQWYLPHRSHLGLEMASPASWACQPGLWPASRGLPAWPRACQPCQESLSGCHLGLPAGSTSLSAALARLFSGPASLTPDS